MKRTILLLPFCLIGCAELQKDFEARSCHYDGAYQAGVNDAQDGRVMNADQLSAQCPQGTRAEVRKGYREGYTTSKRDSAPSALINGLMNRNAQAARCNPKAEAHRGFCGNLNQTECSTHKGVCSWH
jgi:hypothetical protein